MLQHSCVPHNCSAPHSAVYSTRDMCVWFHLLHLTLFTLLVFEQAHRSRRQSACRSVRMAYVYLLVIKSIDSFVPFCLAHMTLEALSLSPETQFRWPYLSLHSNTVVVYSNLSFIRSFFVCVFTTCADCRPTKVMECLSHARLYRHTSDLPFDCRQSTVDGKCQQSAIRILFAVNISF